MPAFRVPGALFEKREPFTFLLYLEWILLAVALLTEIWPGPELHFGRPFPFVRVAVVLVFALLGLRLPTRSLTAKLFYMAVSFALIIAAMVSVGSPFNMAPFLLLLLVIRSCLIFPLSGRLTVAGLVFVTFVFFSFWRVQALPGERPWRVHRHFHREALPPGADRPPPRNLFLPPDEDYQLFILRLTLNSALLFGAGLAFVLLLINAMLNEYANRQKLALANQRLRLYAQRIEDQATLQERNRIARDIHDSLGHSLTALNMQMEMALALIPSAPQKAEGYLIDAKHLGTQALQSVRQSVSALRSDPLLGMALPEALEQLTQTFVQSTRLEVERTIDLAGPLPPEIAVAVYRIAQEGLTNISRHAAATKVELEVRQLPGMLHLRLEDDGQGFDPAQNATGFGLEGMRERAAALAAGLVIDSAPAKGCRIYADFPLPEVL
ncbi:NarL family sensor kinase [Gloeobacter kilaueensis JS1]|uniref:histidine kinase n=2 Tax=Gloeobacter TaxID=33071 RepID=U5QC58_GLOK1|nr:NarL family sensor kinase [Gloeobacter kilaueensis JS1]